MYNKKSIIVICIFLGISFWVGYVSIMAGSSQLNSEQLQNVSSVEKSHFIQVHYFKSKENTPEYELKSDDLIIENQVKMMFQNPNGMFFSEDNRQVNYIAKSGKLDQNTQQLFLEGEVYFEDDKNKHFSDRLSYDGQKDLVNSWGNVKSDILDQKTADQIELTAEHMSSFVKSKIMTLRGNVKGVVKRKRRYEGRMNFAAEQVVVNSPESRIDLDKDVKIQRNNYNLSAGRAEIFLENFNKKLKYYVLYDDVKLEEKVELHSGGTQTRRAYAEKLEAHQQSGRVVLSGAPRVEQGEDIIKGYQITLRENVELVEVDDSKSSFSMKKDKD